jgi:hypothetical protein
LTHEEYLNEPGVTVDWLLAIDNLADEVRAEKQRRQENAGG